MVLPPCSNWIQSGGRPLLTSGQNAAKGPADRCGDSAAASFVLPYFYPVKQMDWKRLLSLKKQGHAGQRKRADEPDYRSSFEVDFDRVVFSAPFRRLQDKTQVVPMPEDGFVHSRLTHSLETASVGRSLGRLVGAAVLRKHPELLAAGYRAYDFGSITAAACLAHDIGNPPFGHSGEKAIASYFAAGPGQCYREQLAPDQWCDLIRYEGNASGFRLLTQTQNGVAGGLRLTYATLGTFTKYPKDSSPAAEPGLGGQKFGFFQAEAETFGVIAQNLGLLPQGRNRWARHPLAFLVEAADDICYTIIDFEDGLNLGLIPETLALEYLIPIVEKRLIREKYDSLRVPADRFAYLRALTIGILLEDLTAVFVEHEADILAGSLSQPLIKKSRYDAQLSDIIGICIEKMYHSKGVIEKELSGFEVLTSLLHHFITAALSGETERSQRDRLLLARLPEEFKGADFHADSTYLRLLNICGFLSGLTDTTALHLFRTLSGH